MKKPSSTAALILEFNQLTLAQERVALRCHHPDPSNDRRPTQMRDRATSSEACGMVGATQPQRVDRNAGPEKLIWYGANRMNKLVIVYMPSAYRQANMATIHLSTVPGSKRSDRAWVNIQSAPTAHAGSGGDLWTRDGIAPEMGN